MRAYLDIETRKVALPEPFVNPSWPNRQPIRKRWQAFMVGIAVGSGAVSLFDIDEEKDEEFLLDMVEEWLHTCGVTEIIYGATRSFDEAILRGTFLNARRELLDEPGPWPHLVSPDRFNWINVGPGEPNPDGLSRHIPDLWAKPHGKGIVKKHCREDVMALQFVDGATKVPPR